MTGRPPFRAATPLETLQQVVSEEPVPLSRLQRKLKGDLETICLKCLQKEPAKRYASAAALADDLRRFLNGEPIMARRTGTPERLWRWGRRNPRVASLLSALVAVFLAGFVGITLQWQRAEREWRRAEQQRDEADKKRAPAQAGRRLGIRGGVDRLSRSGRRPRSAAFRRAGYG